MDNTRICKDDEKKSFFQHIILSCFTHDWAKRNDTAFQRMGIHRKSNSGAFYVEHYLITITNCMHQIMVTFAN